MPQPKILHIAPWACARVFKQVITQQSAGMDVTLMYGRTGHADLLALVSKYRGWSSYDDIKNLSGFDVVVLHTTVDTDHMAKAMPLPDGARLILDCHDYITNENQDRFHAVTCPSKGIAKQFKNSHVIYSKVPLSIIPPAYRGQRINAAILAATIGNGRDWANYEGIGIRLGMPVFIYPSSNEYQGHEHELVMRNVPYLTMLAQMREFRFGYAGSSNDAVCIHDCVTNKFWEYLAAGCSVILRNANEMRELLKSDETQGESIYMESELNKMREAYGL